MMPVSASHSFAADSTSVLSTVCRSKVERLMTLSTSAVASLGTAEHDRADRDTFSRQGDAKDSAVALTPRVLARVGKLVPLGLYISDVNGPPVQHRSTTDRAADEWEEGLGTGLRDRAVMGDKK